MKGKNLVVTILVLALVVGAGFYFVGADSSDLQGSVRNHLEDTVEVETCLSGNGTVTVDPDQTDVTRDGSACAVTGFDGPGDMIGFYTDEDLSEYKRVSFWFRWNDEDADGSLDFDPDKIGIYTDYDNRSSADNYLIAGGVGTSEPYYLEDTWYQGRGVPFPVGTDRSDEYFGIRFDGSDVFTSGDTFYIDKVTLMR
jgi:hypothetical protein